MSFFRPFITFTGWGALGGALGYTLYTRKCKIEPLSPTDYLFGNTIIARFNPNNNPVTSDICKRRVPTEKIKPELLQRGREGPGEDGTKLVEAFCAGVWSGWGYWIQKKYLQRKYQGPETANQLWTTDQFRTSTYAPGTQITDHFEVVAKTENSIIVRAGDSPRVQEVRAADGLFEMTAEVLKEEGVVEFGLKSAFYSGLAQPGKDGKIDPPMSAFVQWLHQGYDKVLMETALKNVVK